LKQIENRNVHWLISLWQQEHAFIGSALRFK